MGSWKRRAIELLTGLAITNKENPAVVPYTPSKTEISSHEARQLKRTSPERRGISSRRICQLLAELEGEKRVNLHNLMILKDGEVISECSRPGYDVNVRHLAHSMSKTLTGIAIGMLVDDGVVNINERVANIFPEYTPKDKRFYQMTVKHLLVMSSGVPFSEFGSVTEYEWTRAFFESRLDFAPGELFAYNSMNSYILARIVVRRSGKSLSAFLKKRLFSPLGITNFFWEVGPEGVEKGGWGVFLSAESWAKIGHMMLSGGVYEGKRILSRRWVVESSSTHMISPKSSGGFNYGYQLWVSRNGDDFLFNGMLGQNVWICPKNNIVVVTSSENNELFQNGAITDTIQRHLGADLSKDVFDGGRSLARLREMEKNFFKSRRWVTPKEPRQGLLCRIGLRKKTPFIDTFTPLLSTFTFAKNNHGILPLFIRAMQNNYSGGIESFKFTRDGEKLFFSSTEGSLEYKIEVGLYDFKTTVLNYCGEKYLVNAIAEASVDKEGHTIYKIELVFPEMPNSRRIKLSLSGDGKLVVKMTEIPNEKLAEPLIESVYTTNPKLAVAIGVLEKRLGSQFLLRKLEGLFSPTMIGADIHSRNYYKITSDETKREKEATNATRSVASLILKLTGED